MNPWLLFILPFASAAIIHLGLKRNATASALLSTASVLGTFILALTLLGENSSGSFAWVETKSFQLNIGYQLDQLATGMMIVVTGIGLLVHVFSLSAI